MPVVIRIGILLVLLTVTVIIVFLLRTPPSLPSPMLAYQVLEEGNWSKAEILFRTLSRQGESGLQSQGYAGLAEVTLAKGDSQKALDIASKAQALDPEMADSHVIRGHILWNQGKIAAAKSAYRTATNKTKGVPWQQANASNRLGRIYAAEGFLGTARKYYDRAINQHPDMAVAYANKAHLLEQLGKRPEAIGLYRQAGQIMPDDRFTAMLLSEAERRQQLAQDKAKHADIKQRVAALLQAHEEGAPLASPDDDWTSTHLTLALLPVQRQGSIALRAGEEEIFVQSLTHNLRESKRLLILDQPLLDMLLQALQRSHAELADSQIALQVGRILAVRLLATSSIVRAGSEEKVNISLLETTTGTIQAQANMTWTSEKWDSIIAQLSHNLLQQLQQSYPLQGRLIRVNSQHFGINIGSEHGVTPGLIMQVFGSAESGQNDNPVGLIEVTTVAPQHTDAKVLQHDIVFQAGWKVQETQQP